MSTTLLLSQSTKTIPVNGTNEVQLLTIGGTPTAGNIQFTWGGRISTTATWSATNATLIANLKAALDGILGAGNTLIAANSLTAGIGTINITFQNSYGVSPAKFLLIATNNLTGTAPTAAITRSTLGVNASYRNASPGAILVYAGGINTDEVQTLTIGGTPTGTFTISGGTAQNPSQTLTTAAITWSATNGTLLNNIEAALDTTFGENNVEVALGTITSGVGTLTLTFQGTNAGAPMPLFTATGLTTGTTTIARTTTGGVAGTGTAPPIPYMNNSQTLFAPNWIPQGAPLTLNLGSPALGSGIAVHAGVADTGSSQTISTTFTQPDVPRCLVFTPSGTTGNVTAVSMIVTGTDCNGNVITETLPAFTNGAATAVTSINAFASVTSYIQPACGASVTITPTCSPKLGLGIPVSLPGRADAWLAGVLEATKPTVTPSTTGLISGNLIQLSSALNASLVQVSIVPS